MRYDIIAWIAAAVLHFSLLQAEEVELPSVITQPAPSFRMSPGRGDDHWHGSHSPRTHLGMLDGDGDKKDGYFLLATSDDGETWSKPRLAVGAPGGTGQRLSGALVGNLWSDPQGRLWLFFDQQLGDAKGRITNCSSVVIIPIPTNRNGRRPCNSPRAAR